MGSRRCSTISPTTTNSERAFRRRAIKSHWPQSWETYLPDYSFGAFWDHQLRWCRTIKDKRKGEYFGVLLSFGLPWAVLGVLAARGAWWSWLLLAGVTTARYAVALVLSLAVLSDHRDFRNLWLLPFRDFVAMFLWGCAYAGNDIEWRGETFHLRDGKLIRIDP